MTKLSVSFDDVKMVLITSAAALSTEFIDFVTNLAFHDNRMMSPSTVTDRLWCKQACDRHAVNCSDDVCCARVQPTYIISVLTSIPAHQLVHRWQPLCVRSRWRPSMSL